MGGISSFWRQIITQLVSVIFFRICRCSLRQVSLNTWKKAIHPFPHHFKEVSSNFCPRGSVTAFSRLVSHRSNSRASKWFVLCVLLLLERNALPQSLRELTRRKAVIYVSLSQLLDMLFRACLILFYCLTVDA